MKRNTFKFIITLIIFLFSSMAIGGNFKGTEEEISKAIKNFQKKCKELIEIRVTEKEQIPQNFLDQLTHPETCLVIISDKEFVLKLASSQINNEIEKSQKTFNNKILYLLQIKEETEAGPKLSVAQQCNPPGYLESFYNNVCYLANMAYNNPGKAILACGVVGLTGYALYQSEDLRKNVAQGATMGLVALPYIAHSSGHLVKFFPSLRDNKMAKATSAILNITNALYNHDLSSALSAISSTISMIDDKNTRDQAFFRKEIAQLFMNGYLAYNTGSPKYVVDSIVGLMLTAPELKDNNKVKTLANSFQLLLNAKKYRDSEKTNDLLAMIASTLTTAGVDTIYGYSLDAALGMIKEGHQAYSDFNNYKFRKHQESLSYDEKYLKYPFAKNKFDEKYLIDPKDAKDSERPFLYRGISQILKPVILSGKGEEYEAGILTSQTGLTSYKQKFWSTDDKTNLLGLGDEKIDEKLNKLLPGDYSAEAQQHSATIGPFKPYTDNIGVAVNFSAKDDGYVVVVDGEALKNRTVNMNANFPDNPHTDQHEFSALGGAKSDDVILTLKFTEGANGKNEYADLIEMTVNPSWLERALMGDSYAKRKIAEAKDAVIKDTQNFHQELIEEYQYRTTIQNNSK